MGLYCDQTFRQALARAHPRTLGGFGDLQNGSRRARMPALVRIGGGHVESPDSRNALARQDRHSDLFSHGLHVSFP
jgi:hypothetical protein